jgi:hypothetical protein
MADELMNMPLEEATPLTRALGHYLNLTSIAELHHRWGAGSSWWGEGRAGGSRRCRARQWACSKARQQQQGLSGGATPLPAPPHARVRRARTLGKNPKSCDETFGGWRRTKPL